MGTDSHTPEKRGLYPIDGDPEALEAIGYRPPDTAEPDDDPDLDGVDPDDIVDDVLDIEVPPEEELTDEDRQELAEEVEDHPSGGHVGRWPQSRPHHAA